MLDLNATTLLRFLKENCRAEGSTYLLHREEVSFLFFHDPSLIARTCVALVRSTSSNAPLPRGLSDPIHTNGHTSVCDYEPQQGGKSVSLYDVTALSAERQKRWKWLRKSCRSISSADGLMFGVKRLTK